MKHIALLSLAVLAGAAPSAFAADDLDITVGGVIRPASCVMTVGNGGNFDHAEINSQLLSAAPNELEALTTSFSLECSSAARWALTAVDARSDVSVPANAFGLGKADNGADIGSYVLSIVDGVADGDAMAATVSLDTAVSWAVPATGNANELSYGAGRLVGFNDAGAETQGPKPIKSFAGTMKLQTTIGDITKFDLNDDVVLDGASTVQIYML